MPKSAFHQTCKACGKTGHRQKTCPKVNAMIVSVRIPMRLQEEFFKLNATRCQAGKKILTRASIMCRLFAKFLFDEAFREDFLEQEQWMKFSEKCQRQWCKENPF